MDIALELILPSPYQPRTVFETNKLREEIEKDGLLTELVVRKRGNVYELLDGERRLRALRELGWKSAPARIVEAGDRMARRWVYKMNKIRDNYSPEEEARYFKSLAEQGLGPSETGGELNIEPDWVQAHLDVFKFPDEIQDAVWNGPLSVSHIHFMRSLIRENFEDAVNLATKAKEERWSRDRLRTVLSEWSALREAAWQEAAKEAAAEILPETQKLEAPEDLKRAADALIREAKRRELEALTYEDWLMLADLKVAQEAEKKAKAEAQARSEEEKRQRKAEEDRQREERAEKKVEKRFLEDPSFLGKVLDKTPKELIEEKLFTEEEREILSKPPKPTTVMDKFYELERLANRLSDELDELQEFPAFGKALLGIALQNLRKRIDEILQRMGIEVIEGEKRLIEEE